MPASPVAIALASRRPARRAFTLTELLVVIALIVLLVSLLLAALGQVQSKSRQTTTLATMQSFSNACEAFRQEHGVYPGAVPENILAGDPRISGTENALLHMMGGVFRKADMSDEEFGEAPGRIVAFRPPGREPYIVKIDVESMGDGPVINRKPYAPYFTPGGRELGIAEGQWNVPAGRREDGNDLRIPDLLDAWGQPIIYLRRQRSVGPLTATTDRPPQFDVGPITPYCDSDQLGKMGMNQATTSLLSVSSDLLGSFERILEHGALPGQAKGSFMLLSAGNDGIYYSITDGPGAPGTGMAVTDISDRDVYPSTIIDEYDDVLTFGGS
jgi:prepilin-type N-terminal cleavage/methylation domain-containing protein